MKILVVTQYYWPENSRVTDIAESLQKANNKVTVLTGLPNYPQGYIYDGYRKGENRIQEHNGVHIIRAKLIERRHDTFHRLLNYYSFPHYASKLIKKLDQDFDIVLAMEESPIMLVKPAIKYAKKYNKPLIMYNMDLWPESLLAGNIKSSSFVYKHYRNVSSKIYSKFDKILVTTKEHIGYIKSLPKCNNLNIDYLAQYADSIFEESDFDPADKSTIDFMFAGNIGNAQSVDTIIKAAYLLKDNPNIRFHIVGSGTRLNDVKQLSKKMGTSNVIFYGQRDLAEMPSLYKSADAMLVTLEDKKYANITIPGKVQTYMAVGKAIIGSINGSCANFILNNKIGYVCPAGDYKKLAKLIESLTIDDLRNIGKNARKVYFEKYSKKIFIDRLLKHMEGCKIIV